MRIKITILIIGVCFSFASANVNSAMDKLMVNEKIKIDPEKLYKQNCRLCHGSKGKLGIGGASDLSKSTMKLSEVITIISEGKGAMTGFSAILNPKEIKAVAKYVQTLKK